MDLNVIVREIASKAVAKYRTADNVAALIAPMVGRTFQRGAVSSWKKPNGNMPDADTFLALARITNSSIDEYLYGPESLDNRVTRLETHLFDGPESITAIVKRLRTHLGEDVGDQTAI